MRKKGFLFLFMLCFIAIGYANGAGRSGLGTSRINDKTNASRARATVTVRSKSKNISGRTNVTNNGTVGRVAVTPTTRPSHRVVTSTRSGLLSSGIDSNKRIISRSVITPVASNNSDANFGTGYNDCRDAYFACMDQFCANVDDGYRRCVCSSRLTEIKQKQAALTQSADSLGNFHDLNLDIIKKSADEVYAMTHATAGEQIATTTTDDSVSAKTLGAISAVLSQTKSKALSNAGTLDAGGDIKSIWSTTDLASGANIANLTGEPLYNAVNAQCSEMVASVCPETALNMVISAYGMYIENDCATLATDLSKKKLTANASIRETGREMGTARLENYDAHNSLSINDCITKIRQDVTADTACGSDFVHCLDVTGLYLNIDTGEPIYSKSFYNLENQISLSGNILNNQTNHMFINTLNNKKIFAQNSLDKCRDVSGDVWDEFMRQAIIEIHQKQQEKIRDVKTNCLDVVNQCYDEKTNTLKDFSNVSNKTLLGLNLETVEDLCRDKLETCSNLYGGGPEGLKALVDNMHDIVTQRIVAECQDLLSDFGQNLCAVQSTDTLHSYPYTCRVYSPGDQRCAPKAGISDTTTSDCTDFNESLYNRFVNYAMQVCIRPSEYENLNGKVPTLVLQDINITMDKIHMAMSQELSKECERLGGIWITTPYTASDSSVKLQDIFYTETGSNTQWGYCKSVPQENKTYTITFQDEGTASFSAIVTYGEKMANIIPPTCSSSAQFNGYWTDPNSSGTQYYDSQGEATREWDIASDTTLYGCPTNQNTNITVTPANQ